MDWEIFLLLRGFVTRCIEVLFYIFYCNCGKENRSLYRGLVEGTSVIISRPKCNRQIPSVTTFQTQMCNKGPIRNNIWIQV